MNKKRKIILGIIIFVVFMGISSFVYASLSNKYEPNQDIGISNISSQIQKQLAISSETSELSGVSSQIQNNPAVSSQIKQSPTVSSQANKNPSVSSQIAKQPAVSSQIQPKETPPDFTVYDSKGNKVYLSDFAGKPIVLNFWASWCPPCKEEMPGFNNAYAKYKSSVIFLMVDMVDGQRETQAKGQQYYDSQGFSFPIYFDNEQQAANAYGISSIPTTFFINSNGTIVKTQRGAMTEANLVQAIEAIK